MNNYHTHVKVLSFEPEIPQDSPTAKLLKKINDEKSPSGYRMRADEKALPIIEGMTGKEIIELRQLLQREQDRVRNVIMAIGNARQYLDNVLGTPAQPTIDDEY